MQSAKKIMWDLKQVIVRGMKSALMVMKDIAPLMFVIYFGMEILNRTGWIYYIADIFAPVMGLCGLPGEAAIVFLVGLTNGIYGAVAAFMTIQLTPWQINILGMMVLISHNVFSEGGILHKSGMPYLFMLSSKLGFAFLFGIVMHCAERVVSVVGGVL